MSVGPLTYLDIYSFMVVEKIQLETWEVDILFLLDDLFMEAMR